MTHKVSSETLSLYTHSFTHFFYNFYCCDDYEICNKSHQCFFQNVKHVVAILRKVKKSKLTVIENVLGGR